MPGAGVVLDLLGRYAEAQDYFARAVKASRTPLDRALARRAMAIAHGFAGDCRGAEKFEASAFGSLEFHRLMRARSHSESWSRMQHPAEAPTTSKGAGLSPQIRRHA